MADRVHVAVYGEVNANLIDGSSVWLQSVCLTLARVPGVHVTLLLRAPRERDLLLRPLADHPNIALVEPKRWQEAGLLTPLGAINALAALDEEDPFDFVVLRGTAVAEAANTHGRFAGRIWLYYVPVAERGGEEIQRLAESAHRVLCQTEEIAHQIEDAAPELSSRLLLLPPMIPAVKDGHSNDFSGSIQQIFYSGKLSPEYLALEMIAMVDRLRLQIPALELHIAGDKIHNPPDDPSFHDRTRAALEKSKGVAWQGAVSREEVSEMLGSADVALSIRHPTLDNSVEMSTKVLEYGAAGCPALLNPTPLHRRLLGDDYPLFATDTEEAVEVLLSASADPDLRREASERVRDLSRRHSFETIASQIAPHLLEKSDEPPGGPASVAASLRLLITGHNLKFATGLVDRARAGGADIGEDRWRGHTVNDENVSKRKLDWAETILCEWCLGNAVWYSRRKRPDQRLVIRFHRMELETPYPGEVELEAVDAIVFVARHVLEAACDRFGWSVEDPRFAVVPNAVERDRFAVPKLPDAEFSLAMVGYVPRIKRLDRAIDVLERLRTRDDRFRLVVKGRGPWEYAWMSTRDEERHYYEEVFRRIDRSPILRQAVVFEPLGDDIPAFFQQAGWILSTSEIEGHSVAVAEGMSSGAVPVVVQRPGADIQYEESWVHGDTETAAAAIFETYSNGERLTEADRATHFSERWSWEELGPIWDRVLGMGATP